MEEDKIFQYEEMAQEGGSTFKLISVETREGVQLRDLGKIAAILRFEIEQE
jgi:stalled ribosome rescue protein Dom34